MAIVYWLISLFFLLFSFEQIDSDIIIWSENYSLTYDDFNAEPDTASSFTAITGYSIDCSFHRENSKAYVEAVCSFDKKKSWMKVKNESILAHERLHFDIAELYTRKIKSYIVANHIGLSDIEPKLHSIYQTYIDSCNLIQDKYDGETAYSLDKEMQAVWNQKIKFELRKLDVFKKKDILVKI